MADRPPIRVVRSRRKTMALQVLDSGEVIARVPLHASQSAIDAMVQSHEHWIERALQRAVRRRENTVYITPEHVEELKVAAREDLPARVERLARQTGLAPTRVTIRNQKTRWGSCSSKGALSLNCQLMLLPAHLRDYVIIHELCHLRHFNHSPAFWALVSSYVEDVASLRRELKEHIIHPLAE